MGLFNNKPADGNPDSDNPAAGNPAAGNPAPEAGKEGKAYKYRCKEACTFNGIYRAKGSVIISSQELTDSIFEPVKG
jgi:hypothetical protein